jgi:outer membrane protein assembly factor BamB
MKTRKFLLLFLWLALAACQVVSAGDDANWPQFRGPNGAGGGQAFRPPVYVMADQPVWKTPLPPGKSSPLVWGDRIFLTGVEGNRLVTLALDARSGALLWKQQAPEMHLAPVHQANSHARTFLEGDAVLRP